MWIPPWPHFLREFFPVELPKAYPRRESEDFEAKKEIILPLIESVSKEMEKAITANSSMRRWDSIENRGSLGAARDRLSCVSKNRSQTKSGMSLSSRYRVCRPRLDMPT